MGKTYDVVIAGGGHNALATGAYLAKAGMEVCIVEKMGYVGGAVATREIIAPGFRLDTASVVHLLVHPNPLLMNDELGLISKYGLKYITPDVQVIVHFQDGERLTVYKDVDKTCQDIARFSEKDAEAYRRFYNWGIGSLNALLEGFFAPPPPFGTFMEQAGQTAEGRELLRALMMSSIDIVSDWFENEKVRVGITRFVTEAMMHPGTKGTGLQLLLLIPLLHEFGMGLPVGGSGALSESLERCLLDYGATIKTGVTVKEFKVAGGECKGIVLQTGEEIIAKKVVISNLNIKQMFPGMVDKADLPAGFIPQVQRLYASDFAHFFQGYALHEAPDYKAGSEIKEALMLEFAPNTLEEYLRYFDDIKYGIPRHSPLAVCQTYHDPSRAPEGKHTLYLYEYAPYHLKSGGPKKWDEIKQDYANTSLGYLREYTTNMGDENIIGRFARSPIDSERWNWANLEGDFAHIGSQLWQSMGNRPLPIWNYRTPVKKLYLSSASCHPGTGVMAGAGRAAAMVIMEDLGLSFEKVVS